MYSLYSRNLSFFLKAESPDFRKVPPHGGVGLGLERIVQLSASEISTWLFAHRTLTCTIKSPKPPHHRNSRAEHVDTSIADTSYKCLPPPYRVVEYINI